MGPSSLRVPLPWEGQLLLPVVKSMGAGARIPGFKFLLYLLPVCDLRQLTLPLCASVSPLTLRLVFLGLLRGSNELDMQSTLNYVWYDKDLDN